MMGFKASILLVFLVAVQLQQSLAHPAEADSGLLGGLSGVQSGNFALGSTLGGGYGSPPVTALGGPLFPPVSVALGGTLGGGYGSPPLSAIGAPLFGPPGAALGGPVGGGYGSQLLSAIGAPLFGPVGGVLGGPVSGGLGG